MINFLLQIETVHRHQMDLIDEIFGDGDKEFVCYNSAHRNFYLAIFISVLLVLLVSFYLIYFRKKINDKLKEQNKVISDKNLEIHQSLVYASRIQSTTLSDTKIFNHFTKDSFVYFKPKDIVSGDLYYLKDTENYSYVLLADCTGHGVPGSLISMIVTNSIYKALDANVICNPSQLLSLINLSVKAVLKQDENSEIKDGAEASLVIIDKLNKKIHYAGAGRPMIIINDGVLNLVKADKHTIGSHQPHLTEPPVNRVFDYKSGDKVFLYSDGVTDQFGGENIKKFSTKRLHEIIENDKNHSLNSIKEKLISNFEKWKGNHEQTDDIALIGFELI